MSLKATAHANELHPSSNDCMEPDAVLVTTHAIASVGIATLDMLETLLPAVANEVERESKALANNFTKLIKYITANEIPPQYISDIIAHIIVGMQFQDRNTQIMDNVTSILGSYRAMLQGVRNTITAARNNDIADCSRTMSEASEAILSGIRLSDIRLLYIQALKKSCETSHEVKILQETSESISNEIELF